MPETVTERKARLEAELSAIENEDREALIRGQVDETSLSDVVQHLVQHSGGYPSRDEREVHTRAVRKHFGTGEYDTSQAKTASSSAKSAS